MKKTPYILLMLMFSTLSTMATQMKASSFGFNATDATQCLQKAIDSGAHTIIVDNVGKPWIVTGITLRSNLELIFAPGVQVQAKRGAFKSLGACLFKMVNCDNVTMRGQGNVILSMNKKDYQNTQLYEWSEWRHLLCILSSSNVRIQNLKLMSSGGDGIYIGTANRQNFCRNVLIEQVEATNHHRQGISVITVDGLHIKNCSFNNTSGTPPKAGIDFEPNFPGQRLSNILVENTAFNGNEGGGLFIHTDWVQNNLSMVIRNCIMKDNGNGIYITLLNRTKKVGGSILFENCHIKDNAYSPLVINGAQDQTSITFKDCVLDARNGKSNVNFNTWHKFDFAKVFFEKTTLLMRKGPAIAFESTRGAGLAEITGSLEIKQPNGQTAAFDFPAFVAAHPVNPRLQNFNIVSLNRKLWIPMKPEQAGKNAAPETYFRGQAKILQFVRGNSSVRLAFKLKQIGQYSKKADIKILDVDGHDVDHFVIREDEGNYVLKSANDMLYTLEINSHNHLISLNYGAPGQAIWTDQPTPLFGGKHRFYFVVPAKVKDIFITITPSANEPLCSQLIDPQGKVVLEHPKGDTMQVLKYTRPHAAKAEIWSFRIPWAQEDFSFCLGAPLPPLVSTAPENLLIRR